MARPLEPSAPETASYHGEIRTDARGYATVRLPTGAGRLLPSAAARAGDEQEQRTSKEELQ